MLVLIALRPARGALHLPAGDPARRLPREGRGQPHLDRAGAAQPRPDPRPQRRGAWRATTRATRSRSSRARSRASSAPIDELAELVDIHAARPRAASGSCSPRRATPRALPIRTRLSDEEVATFAANRYPLRGRRDQGAPLPPVPLRRHRLARARLHGPHQPGRTRTRLEEEGVDAQLPRHRLHRQGRRRGELPRAELHGTTGFEQVEIDAAGRGIRTLSRTPSQPGNNVALTPRSCGCSRSPSRRFGERRGAAGGDRALDRRRCSRSCRSPASTRTSSSTASTRSTGRSSTAHTDQPLNNRAIAGDLPAGLDLQAVHGARRARDRQAHPAQRHPRPRLLRLRRPALPRLKPGGHGYASTSSSRSWCPPTRTTTCSPTTWASTPSRPS